MEAKVIEEWRPMITNVIASKVTELQMLGYNEATANTVWACLKSKVWRKVTEKKLHQIVEDVLHLNAHVFMSYITMQSHQSDDLMSSIAAIMDNN
ncbi:Post-transcriptional regulator [Amphibacillus marinus]|uniref:Post-transcriptional regulator n=1 Tax=Amphibacillus marinus TaxID=872970 RepID=A0A1H8NZA1_9BACI|nr:post-transcriptional regulator [Amphibacillus marinus]SEO34990.1 Post-transcriptional regulator [Amphibacillus marinus]